MKCLGAILGALDEGLRIVFHDVLDHPLVLVHGLFPAYEGEHGLKHLNGVLAFDHPLELILLPLDIVGHHVGDKILLLGVVLVEGLLRDAKLAADVIDGHLADSIL